MAKPSNRPQQKQNPKKNKNLKELLAEAESFAKQGHHQKARISYKIAVSLNPNSVKAILGLASQLEEMGRLQLAEQEYQIANSRFPDHLETYLQLSSILEKMGRTRKALNVFKKAVKIFLMIPVFISD